MSDLISVIIPAYNTGEKIKATLESVINQDYENLEIILVNDASTDNTLEIARSVLKNSNQPFKIIEHENNQGICISRNHGFENASGEYIAFMDHDDLVAKNFLSHLHDLAIKNNSDVAICGYIDRFFNPDRDVKQLHKIKHFSENGDNFVLAYLAPPIWCCLYKKDFLEKSGVKFFNGVTVGEDIEFQMKIMTHAKNIIVSDECLYFYIHHPAMTSTFWKRDSVQSYTLHTQAHLRTAKYILKNANNDTLKSFVKKILLPEAFIRIFTTLAMKNNFKNYKSLLKKSFVKKILCDALNFYTLFKKPEIFFKALLISIAPKIYYKSRS